MENVMPLIQSGSEEAVGKNIAIEKHAHPDMPQKQAIAIAENTKRANDEGPFGASLPMEGNMNNQVEQMHDNKGYTQAGPSLEDIAEMSRQMWSENVNDPENANGVVTPECNSGH